MANRYVNTTILRDKNNKRYLKSNIYPEVEITSQDKYFYTVAGDRLDNISFEFYGDPEFWWIIATANNLRRDTWYVTPGTQLRIPNNPYIYMDEYNIKNILK
jgi:hypothetical protein